MVPNPTFEIFNSESKQNSAKFLLCAEHSGVHVPSHLNEMGLPPSELHRHIGWDIGIDGTARNLLRATGLPTILGQVSRLVVDLNRPVHSAECIPEYSDNTCIPANQGLSHGERERRLQTYYLPFHRALNNLIKYHRPKILLCLHSFTPQLRAQPYPRPWHCGVLFDRNVELGNHCLNYLRALGGLHVGENQPYRVDHNDHRSVPLHGELKGIPTLLLEIRNDLIEDRVGQERWASIIASLVGSIEKQFL